MTYQTRGKSISGSSRLSFLCSIMPQCCVPYCLNRSETKQYLQLSFYRFPCDEKEKKRWLQLIRRENYIPNCNSRVCSWHFPNGKEGGPTRFAWNEGKTFRVPDRSSHPPKQRKQTAPNGGEDEGTDRPQDPDTAQNPAARQAIMELSSKRRSCSVAFCTNNKLKSPDLTFHEFPVDTQMCARWLKAIKRDQGPTFKFYCGGTYVCSQHFGPEDTYISDQGEVQLLQGAVPSKFPWNDWGYGDSNAWESLFRRSRKRLHAAGPDDSEEMSVPEDDTEEPLPTDPVARDHDYACHRSAGTLDGANQRIEELELEVLALKIEIEQLTAQKQQPLIFKFCNADEDFQHYTRFSSKEVFTVFWESVYPSDSRLVYWSKAQRTAPVTSSTQRELPLVDELFMFLCRVAAGLQEKTLSSIFEVSLSTVRCTILTWTSYLYQVLGSLPLWMTRQQVQASMPDKFRLYCPQVRVIIHSTEIQCETATSLSQSEKVPHCKNHTSYKGLIGIAPCGVITFVSKLYAGSISDDEITQKSQILELIEPGDRVVAHKGFQIKEMLSEVGATLIAPPLKTPPMLSHEDSHRIQAFVRLMNLAESAVCRVREYHIWDGPVPLSMVGSVNQLWVICCLMSNYQGALDIKRDKPAV